MLRSWLSLFSSSVGPFYFQTFLTFQAEIQVKSGFDPLHLFPLFFMEGEKGDGRRLCFLWVPLESPQGQGHDSSSCGCLPESSVGPGRCSQIPLFWTSLSDKNRVTSLLCFNEDMWKARGSKREELWSRVEFGSFISTLNFCHVVIHRPSWCDFLWCLHSIFNLLQSFCLNLKTFASCLQHLPFIRLPVMRWMIAFLRVSSISLGNTESESRGRLCPCLWRIALLLFRKLQKIWLH